MKKMMKQWISAAALATTISGGALMAQAPAPLAPAPAARAPQAGPQAPAPQAAAVKFPPINLKNFTADSPASAEVNDFLKALWGYDENRTWEVAAILKTEAPGVAKIVVYVAEEGQGGGARSTVFFSTPDGKHVIADQVIDFGAKPFAGKRKMLQDRANGAAEGATSKDLMLVEFADLQCPHCKEAQDTMDNLAKDFPQARIVYQDFPLVEIHPYAFAAAAEGVCVRKEKGDAAFFTYVKTVYDKQAGLTEEAAGATLATAAAAAGADPKAVATCAKSDETKHAVEASIQLGKDVGVDQTPLLFANGHALPLGGIPYETLKKIIAFQAGQDGIVVHLQPTLSTLK
jgi:protein-disulfide isomerase